MNPITLALMLWAAATLMGTVFAVLAAVELRSNWLTVNDPKVASRPTVRKLREILKGDILQHSFRVAMELVCWATVIIAVFADNDTIALIIGWLLVLYRMMHTINSAIEYLSKRHRRLEDERSKLKAERSHLENRS